MRFHLISLVYAVFLTIGFFVILTLVHDQQETWCNVQFDNSTATMPCTELNRRVYEVKL